MAIALGGAHAVAVTEEGGIYAWGAGAHGQLGTGDLVPKKLKPTLVCEQLGIANSDSCSCAPICMEQSLIPSPPGTCWHSHHRSMQAALILDQSDVQSHASLIAKGAMPRWCACRKPRGRLPPLGDCMCCVCARARCLSREMDLQVRWSALIRQNKQVAVTEDGGCWTWGFGANGRLGHGNEERVISPKKVPPKLLHGAKAVMAACSSLLAGHTALVTDDGRLWTWGRGSEGQLGHHDMQAKMVPTPIARELFGGAFIALVACGGSHTACVTNVGALWSWGAGEWGQLGHGDIERREVPVVVKGTGEGGVRIVVVSCGDRNTAAVTSLGTLWAWGAGDAGRLGLGDELDRLDPAEIDSGQFNGNKVATVDCGLSHTGAVTIDGGLWMWGSGFYGQLGIGNTEDEPDRLLPTQVSVDGMENDRFATLSCGTQTTTAVTLNGVVWAWGCALQGVLGHGDESPIVQPARVNGICSRIGRCRQLPESCATAFAMSQHHRLGRDSKAMVLVGDLVQRVLESAHSWPHGPSGQVVGVVRLMGGGLQVPPGCMKSSGDGMLVAGVNTEEGQAMEQGDEEEEEEVEGLSGRQVGAEIPQEQQVLQPAVEGEQDEAFVLRGHEIQSLQPADFALPSATTPDAAASVSAGVTAHDTPLHAASSTSTSRNITNHVILPVLRLAGGARARPVFNGTALVMADSSPSDTPYASASTAMAPGTTPSGCADKEVGVATVEASTSRSARSAPASNSTGSRWEEPSKREGASQDAALAVPLPWPSAQNLTSAVNTPALTPVTLPSTARLASAQTPQQQPWPVGLARENGLRGAEDSYPPSQPCNSTALLNSETDDSRGGSSPPSHLRRQIQALPGSSEGASVMVSRAREDGNGRDVGSRDENLIVNRMMGIDSSCCSTADATDLLKRYGDNLGEAMPQAASVSSLSERQQSVGRRDNALIQHPLDENIVAGHDCTVAKAMAGRGREGDRDREGAATERLTSLASARVHDQVRQGAEHVSYVDRVLTPVLPAMLPQTRVISTIRGYQLGGVGNAAESSHEERRRVQAAAAEKRALQGGNAPGQEGYV